MATKKILLVLIVVLFALELKAQTAFNLTSFQFDHGYRIPEPQSLSRFKKLSFFAGYHLNFQDSLIVKDSFHFFELGVKKSFYTIPRFGSLNLYTSSEIRIGGSDLIIGPKIGSYINLYIFTFGLETIYYTDFDNHSMRLAIQALGIGTESVKLSINPHIILYDTGIKEIGNGSFSITFDIFTLFKKETILK